MDKDTARKHLSSAKALLGLTNRKIAEATGVWNTTVGRYVNGEMDVTEEWAEKFCENYHLDIGWFMSGEASMTRSGQPDESESVVSKDVKVSKNVSVHENTKTLYDD